MRCFARLCLGGAEARALALRSFGFVACRAMDLLAILRAGDFFCAAVRAAARDVGFCLAIPCLPDPGAPGCRKRRSSRLVARRQRGKQTLPRASSAVSVANAAGTRRP